MTARISQDDYKKVKEILADALERAPAERAGFLRAACGDGNKHLLAEVESLLAESEKSAVFLEDFSAARIVQNSISNNETPVGERIGNYRLEKEIGRGGMGVVFLATRGFSPASRFEINQTRNGFGRHSRTLSQRARDFSRAQSSVYRATDRRRHDAE